MLRDERKEREPAIFVENTLERKLFIANFPSQFEEFLAKGGTIDEIKAPTGLPMQIKEPRQSEYERGRERAKTKLGLKDPMSNSPISLLPYKNRTTSRSAHGQNIRKSAKGFYSVQVGSIELGKGEKWDYEKAVSVRDKVRAENGYPPAEY